MNSKDNFLIEEFYERLIEFLISNDLEKADRFSGYDNSDIKNFERQNEIIFPAAYRLFLTNFAKGKPRFFDGQDYKLESVNYFRETAEKLQKKALSNNIFVFTEWQRYNYYYFGLNLGNNPEVIFGIIASDDPNEYKIDESSEGCFTDWLCKRIEISLKQRERLEGLRIQNLKTELERIKNIANTM